MKKIIIAPDSYKGTLTANEICEIIGGCAQEHFPEAEIYCIPMADGGEGMTEAYLAICGGECVAVSVTGPLGQKTEAVYGILPDGRAVMEMAACAGLPLVGEHKDPMHATTYGVGEMLLDAKKRGVTEVLMGIGGSATNDCGIGMATALGYVFYDAKGSETAPYACNMESIAHIKKPEQPLGMKVIAACDVKNVLYGPSGATYTFGMQKGADEKALKQLDAGLMNISRVIQKDLGIDTAQIPGGGAAGGLGAGLLAFTDARLTPGIELLLDTVGFDALLEDAGIVFTGEGRIDWQSAYGKVPVGVAKRAKAKGVPCIALCGSIGNGAECVYENGITAIFSSVNTVADFETIKKTCRQDLKILADSVMRVLSIQEN